MANNNAQAFKDNWLEEHLRNRGGGEDNRSESRSKFKTREGMRLKGARDPYRVGYPD